MNISKLSQILSIIVSYFALGLVSIRDYIFSSGIIGLVHDWNIPALKYQLIERMDSSFYFWNDIYGISKIYPTFIFERVLFEIPIGIILDFNSELFSKLLIAILITISGICMFYLGKGLKFSNKTSFLIGLFYVLTPLMYNKIIAGHHFYLFAYSISPLFLLFLHKYVETKKFQYIICASLVIGISSAQIQFILMLLLIGLIYLFFEFKNLKLKRFTFSTIILFVLPILLNAFWIVPNVLNFQPETTTAPLKGATLDYYEIQHATQLPTAFEMIGYNHDYDPYYLLENDNLSPLIIIFLLAIVIITILGALVNFNKSSKKRLVLFSLVLLILGLFFVTAVNGPLPEIWEFIYTNVPFLTMFREVYHSMFLIVFAYSILIGISIEEIQKKFKRPIFKKSIFVLFLIIILLVGIPILNSYMNQLQSQSLTSEEIETYNFLRNEQEISRVIYVPGIAPIKFTNLEKPFVDYMIDYSPKPTFPQTVTRTNPLESISQYYFLNAIQSPEKINFINKLVSKLGVEYLVCKNYYSSLYPDYVSMQKYLEDLNKDISTYTNWKKTYFIYNNIINYAELVKSIGNNKILKIENSSSFIDVNSKIIQLSKFSEIFPLLDVINNNTAVVIKDTLPEFQSDLDEFTNYLVIGSNGNSFFPSNTKFISPNSLNYNPENNWSIDLHSWYINPLITLSPLDNGNTVLTWRNKKAEYNGDLDDLYLLKNWNFSYGSNVEQWKQYTQENQWDSLYQIIWDSSKDSLKVELYNSTWGWKTINSPFISAEYGSHYNFRFRIKGENAHQVQIYVKEFDSNKTLIEDSFYYASDIGDGTFDWKDVSLEWSPENESTKFLQLQIWHGHETDKNLPNILWLKDCKVYSGKAEIVSVSLDIPFEIEKTNDYRIFIHYLRNNLGDTFQIYLNDINTEIQSKDQLDNFVWQEIFTTTLEKGNHELIIENIKGLNAVDKIAIISEAEYNDFIDNLEENLENKSLIYAMDSESDLHYKGAEKSQIFVNQACNGNVLEISNQGSAWQTLNILKDDYYKIGLKSKGRLLLEINQSTTIFDSENFTYSYSNPIYLSKGEYDLKVLPKSYENTTSWTFNDEESIIEWQEINSEIQFNAINKITLDENEKAMKTELFNSTWGWKIINSPCVSVEQDKKYNYLFEIKGENAHQLQIYIRELDENKSLIEDSFYYASDMGDGTFDWKDVTFDYTPKNKDTKFFQLQIFHGHETNKTIPNVIWLRNSSFSEYSSVPNYLDTIFLFSVNSSTSNSTIETIFSEKEKQANIISYEKINPTLWKAEIEASGPFILSFLDGYDQSWSAYVNGQEYKSVKLYSTVNGFLINQTGLFEVIIKYKPQDLFDIGLIISIATLVFSILLIIYSFQKKSKYFQAIFVKIKDIFGRVICLRNK